MGNMTSLIDMLICFAGVYVLYCYFLMITKKEIKEGIIISKGTPIKKCKDKDGYIKEMAPKVLVFGIATTICGAVGIAEGKYNFFGMYYLIFIGVFLAVTVWFAIAQKKLTEKYWPASALPSVKKK